MSAAVRAASRCVSWYLRSIPIQKGKHALWAAAAKRLLAAEVKPGVWVRVSGLTAGEKKLFLRQSKEPRSVEFVSELLEPGMVAYDVGANIGYYSLIFASLVGNEGRVHAFEPTPDLAERIRLNAALNGFSQITVNQVAVADSSGSALLHLSLEDPEANSLFHVEEGARQIPVPMTTLDEYSAKSRMKSADLIKIDCEGSELNVLRGAAAILQGSDGPVLMLECNVASLTACGETVAELLRYLADAHYECFCLEQLRGQPDPVWNLVALKRSHKKVHQLVQRLKVPVFSISAVT